MTRRAGLVLGGLLVAAADARGAVAIEHRAGGCVVAGQFPRFEARLDPAGTAAQARIFFRADSPLWYTVAMKAEGESFAGVLPKPTKKLKSFVYYIEVTDPSLATARTEEHTLLVESGPGACQGRVLTATVASAAVVVTAPAVGLPLVPAGFASAGVAAGSAAGAAAGAGVASGGGGISGTALVVGGAALAAVGVVVATKVGGGSGSSSGTCNSPNRLDVVERSATTLTLRWSVSNPPASGCYTVDYLLGQTSCSMIPPHGNIHIVQGTTTTITGLTPSTGYQIHVHALSTCSGGSTNDQTDTIFVTTLPPGAGTQPVTPADYQSCC